MLRAIKKIALDKRYKWDIERSEISEQIESIKRTLNKDSEKVHYEQIIDKAADVALREELERKRKQKARAESVLSFWDKICKLLRAEVHKYEYELSFKTRAITIVATDWYDAEKQIRKLCKKTGIHGEFKREIE